MRLASAWFREPECFRVGFALACEHSYAAPDDGSIVTNSGVYELWHHVLWRTLMAH